MSNQSRIITLKNGTTLTASVNVQNKQIELSYSDGKRDTVPQRKPSKIVEKNLEIDSDPGGFVGKIEDVIIHALIQSDHDDSISLAYSDMESLNNYIVCLCDKRVGENWQVCEDPIAQKNLNIQSVELTTEDDNTHPSGWKFLMTVKGKKGNDPYLEKRGH